MKPQVDEALTGIQLVVTGEERPRAKLERVVEIVREAGSLYDWVGIYYLRGSVLELGPFVGPPTDHTRIPVGTGVCGLAVKERRNQVVDDVRSRDNYLSCSPSVRSEIVVLIWSGHDILGEIDIDSNSLGAFTAGDERFLEEVARLIAPVVDDMR
jgi:GAF domain-containing protein